MRGSRRQWLDHGVLQLCARGLQGQLRQPPQDHSGRLHRQHELPPHGNLLTDILCKINVPYSSPQPSARTRWTGWGSVSTSWHRATTCGPRARTWSSMFLRGAARWGQTFRFGPESKEKLVVPSIQCQAQLFVQLHFVSGSGQVRGLLDLDLTWTGALQCSNLLFQDSSSGLWETDWRLRLLHGDLGPRHKPRHAEGDDDDDDDYDDDWWW